MKKILANILLLALIAFSLPQLVLAEDSDRISESAANDYTIRIEKIKSEARERAEKIRTEAEIKRAELIKEVESRRAELRDRANDDSDDDGDNEETGQKNNRERIENKNLASSTDRDAAKEIKRLEQVEKSKERIRTYASLMVNRFEAAVERLNILSERIDGRIIKLEAEGIDVRQAKDLMATAKSKIVTAKTEVQHIESALTMILTSDTPREALNSAKKLIDTTRDSVKSAHAALVDVVNSLKPGQNRDKSGTATTTESDSNSTN